MMISGYPALFLENPHDWTRQQHIQGDKGKILFYVNERLVDNLLSEKITYYLKTKILMDEYIPLGDTRYIEIYHFTG